MDSIGDLFIYASRYITTLRVTDVIDILILAVVIYWLIGFIVRTNSSKVAYGLVLLLALLWVSELLQLNATSYILGKIFEYGILAMIILFQPEIRRSLEKVGAKGVSFLFRTSHENTIEASITQTVFACREMAQSRTGALIVFERDNLLTDVTATGTLLDATVTAELLKNIFFNKAPLHDGAVVIRGSRIEAAGCMLPLSGNGNLSRDLGMRHRAGIGISETTDAVVVIVSEETGSISLAVGGMLKRHLKQDVVESMLRRELLPNDTAEEKNGTFKKLLARLNKDGEN